MEDKVEKNTQKEQQKEKRLRKNEEVLRVLQDNMKHKNICIIVVPEGEEEQWIEKLFEKSNDGKLHQLDERKCHTNPGNTESPNQEEHKETHFETHHHQNGKIPRKRENLEDSKGETGSNIKRSPHKASS